MTFDEELKQLADKHNVSEFAFIYFLSKDQSKSDMRIYGTKDLINWISALINGHQSAVKYLKDWKSKKN